MFKPKTILVFIALFLLTLRSSAENQYQLSLQIKGASSHKFYLLNIYGGLQNRDNIKPIDSIQPSSDTFSMEGHYNETQFYSLAMDSLKRFVPFIIDTGKTTFQGNADSFPTFRVRNSWQNDKLRAFGINTNPLIFEMNKQQSAGNKKQYDSLMNVYQDSILVFTKRNPNSYGIFKVAGDLQILEDRFIPFGKKWFPLISDELKNSTKGKQIAYILYRFNADSFIGKPFPEIATFNLAKKKTTLKLDDKNVYLIDYWASWCVPCLEKLPALKKLYEDHKKDGFKIISISIDMNYEAWLKAVNKHVIKWENYSSLNGVNAEDTKYFNIQSIPFTVLVGRNNKIIKINPTEEEIKASLKNN